MKKSIVVAAALALLAGCSSKHDRASGLGPEYKVTSVDKERRAALAKSADEVAPLVRAEWKEVQEKYPHLARAVRLQAALLAQAGRDRYARVMLADSDAYLAVSRLQPAGWADMVDLSRWLAVDPCAEEEDTGTDTGVVVSPPCEPPMGRDWDELDRALEKFKDCIGG